MPDPKYKDYLVGIGDSLVILNDKKYTNITFSKLISKNFGKCGRQNQMGNTSQQM